MRRIALIDPPMSFATKRRVMFSCQMDTKRKRMTRIIASAEPVDPMIADANASRGQGIISRECLIGARIVVAPLEDHVALAIEDFATPLCISAQRGGLTLCISDDDLLTVLPK